MNAGPSPSTPDPAFLGIEIGGTKLQLALGDSSLGILRRWRFTVDRAQGAAGIRRQIQSVLSAGLPPVAGVGVGFGGPVDGKTGRISCSHQIGGWSEFDLGQWLQGLTRAPVQIDNDANVAAFGEALRGAGRGSNPVFYVTLGSGVGGGLVVNDRIYHGATPGEAEIGHVRLDRSGVIVEERCSGWAIDRRIRDIASRGGESLLAPLAGPTPGGEARHLAEALRQSDPTARAILGELTGDLAFALSHVAHLFHPQMIVLGGGLSLLGEPLRAGVAEHLPAFLMKAFRPGPVIRLAELGEDAVPIGALALAKLRQRSNHQRRKSV